MAHKAEEYPILFKPRLVRAILDGLKTETRRIIKPPPKVNKVGNFCYDGQMFPHDTQGNHVFQHFVKSHCPYGSPGDIIWVRETWHPHTKNHWDVLGKKEIYNLAGISYKADNPDVKPGFGDSFIPHDRKFEFTPRKGWHPSIHMPRFACRLTLRNKHVSVERIQDIDYQGVIAEGLSEWITDEQQTDTAHIAGAIKAFSVLWNSLHASPKPVKENGEIHHYESYPWQASHAKVQGDEYRGKPHIIHGNPWVWVVKFKIHEAERPKNPLNLK